MPRAALDDDRFSETNLAHVFFFSGSSSLSCSSSWGVARAVPARGIEDAQEREPQMPRAEDEHGT
jgi:hypothetical protein